MRRYIKGADVIIALIVLTVALLIYVVPEKGETRVLCIYIDGVLERQIDLRSTRDSEFKVVSEFGYNVLKIEDGEVYVTESSCENKLEINAGKISKAGQSLICVPNRFVAVLEGKDDYDAITY